MKNENNLLKDATTSVLAKVKAQKRATAKLKKQGKTFDDILMNFRKNVSSPGGSSVKDKDPGTTEELSLTQRMEELNRKIRNLTNEVKQRMSK